MRPGEKWCFFSGDIRQVLSEMTPVGNEDNLGRVAELPLKENSPQSGTAQWLDATIFNTLRPRQNGRLFSDDIFKCIFLNKNIWILIKISLTFVPKGPINNIKALVQIMAWRRPGDKPLSEPMMVRLLTHLCVTRPQWVNRVNNLLLGYSVCCGHVL